MTTALAILTLCALPLLAFAVWLFILVLQGKRERRNRAPEHSQSRQYLARPFDMTAHVLSRGRFLDGKYAAGEPTAIIWARAQRTQLDAPGSHPLVGKGRRK